MATSAAPHRGQGAATEGEWVWRERRLALQACHRCAGRSAGDSLAPRPRPSCWPDTWGLGLHPVSQAAPGASLAGQHRRGGTEGLGKPGVCRLGSQLAGIAMLAAMTAFIIGGSGCRHHTRYYQSLLHRGYVVSSSYHMPGTRPSTL